MVVQGRRSSGTESTAAPFMTAHGRPLLSATMTAVTPAAWARRSASDSGRLASTVTAGRATEPAVRLGSFSMTRLRRIAWVAPSAMMNPMNSKYSPAPLERCSRIP